MKAQFIIKDLNDAGDGIQLVAVPHIVIKKATGKKADGADKVSNSNIWSDPAQAGGRLQLFISYQQAEKYQVGNILDLALKPTVK